MAPMLAGSKQAEQLKQDGNLYFSKNRLGAAIDAYTEVFTTSKLNLFFLFDLYFAIQLVFFFFFLGDYFVP